MKIPGTHVKTVPTQSHSNAGKNMAGDCARLVDFLLSRSCSHESGQPNYVHMGVGDPQETLNSYFRKKHSK